MLKSYRDYLLDSDPYVTTASYEQYRSDPDLHEKSGIYASITHSTRRLTGMSAAKGAHPFQLRHYTCAPTSYILIVDDHALVEQFHYGKPPHATDSAQAQLHLTKEMPLVEYCRPRSPLYMARPEFDPLAVITDHYNQVYEWFAHEPAPRKR